MSVVVHGAGRNLTVAGPVHCWDCFEADCRGVLLSRRDSVVEGKRVWPVCCDHIEENSKHNLGEGFGKFNEDEFLVDKEWVGGEVSGQVMINALGCQCGVEVQSVEMSVVVIMEVSVLMGTENLT